MAEITKSIVVKFKPGEPLLNEDFSPKLDENEMPLLGPPKALRTVEIKNLTSREAMDADDFALAASPTGNPSADNRIRAFAICSIRMIDKETILRVRTLKDYNDLIDRFDRDELYNIGQGYLEYTADVNRTSDPKDLPSAT